MWKVYVFIFCVVSHAAYCETKNNNGNEGEILFEGHKAGHPKQIETGDIKIKTHIIQTDKLKRSLKNNNKDGEITTRQTPTKPTNDVIKENPPKLSIEVKNVDSSKRQKRSFENKFRRTSECNEKPKRSLYDAAIEANAPYERRSLQKIRRVGNDFSEERARRHDKGDQKSRSSDPSYSYSGEDQAVPVQKPDDNERMMPIPISPISPILDPALPVYETPKPIDNFERPRPHGRRTLPLPRITQNPYPAPHASCLSCNHRHDQAPLPYSRESEYYRRHGQVDGIKHSRLGDARSRSFHQTTYFPGSKLIINRRFTTIEEPIRAENREADYDSSLNDRNEYPLAQV